MASENPSPLDLEAALHSVVDDTADEVEASAAESDEHLDQFRIQKLAKLRRATIRAHSWCLIGAVIAFFTAVELVWKAMANGLRWTTCGWGMAAVGSGVVGAILARQCVALQREIRRPIIGERGHTGFEVVVNQPLPDEHIEESESSDRPG
jgi:hypothetical protein